MAHNSEETTICPNCNFPATHNYCAQCGQETHLHKETFWALIMHFIGHYFHYDSKFWQTLRVLVFKPGELTVAYWNKLRARYIPPVSLYIFISAVYFLVSFLALPTVEKSAIKTIENKRKEAEARKSTQAKDVISGTSTDAESTIDKNLALVQKDPQKLMDALEPIMHNLPKLYFFLIPFMGLILKLLFLKQKDLFFADHVVFSLHFHSFYFLTGLFETLFQFFPGIFLSVFAYVLSFAIKIILAVYFIKSIQNAYKISTSKAVAYSLTIGLVYLLVSLAIGWAYFYYILSSTDFS